MANISDQERKLRMTRGMLKRVVYMQQYRELLLQSQLQELNKKADKSEEAIEDSMKKKDE